MNNNILKDKNLYIFIAILYCHFSPRFPADFRFWGFIAFLLMFSFSIKGKGVNNKRIEMAISSRSFPFVFAIAYSFFLLVIGETDFVYVQRGLSQAMRDLCFIYAGYAILAKYKESAVLFLFISFAVTYFIITLDGIARFGLIRVLYYSFDMSASRFSKEEGDRDFDEYFEFHEFGLTMPFSFILKKDQK